MTANIKNDKIIVINKAKEIKIKKILRKIRKDKN